METLRNYFLPDSEKAPPDEQVVFLPRGNPTIQGIMQKCKHSPHRYTDMSATGTGHVGAIIQSQSELAAVLSVFISSGRIAARRQEVEKDPDMVKLAICPVPISRDGKTVVNTRVWGQSVFLALPVMETIVPDDFELVMKLQAIIPSMGDLAVLGTQRALEEEAEIQPSYMNHFPIGFVGGGKDLGILVLVRTSPIISLEAFRKQVVGYTIPVNPRAYANLAHEIGGKVDGWTYSTLSLLQANTRGYRYIQKNHSIFC